MLKKWSVKDYNNVSIPSDKQFLKLSRLLILQVKRYRLRITEIKPGSQRTCQLYRNHAPG
ncbi:hypothetical protein CS542_06285 [Pedobacter sp. IW39]|nr:hypothetical protein CS542_06285 [Pedobacter sp. IW39]